MESFTAEERGALAPYFTNTDRPVFALTNLPEVVKGALFARYSRSAKSLRRLFLDEFLGTVAVSTTPPDHGVGLDRASRLYERVFNEYGDDSVAQLGGAHVACEGVSNVLTKTLERGRLMAYLEQSTRYVPYTDRPQGRWKYCIPKEVERRRFRAKYTQCLDFAFEIYARWLEPLQEHYRQRHPRAPGDSNSLYSATIRAKALDALRGLLPAATCSNVGIYGSGQAFEALLLRLRAHPLAEAQTHADSILEELRKVIPAFLVRVDRPDRGGRWSEYLAQTREETRSTAARLLEGVEPEPRSEDDQVALTEWDPEGEVKVVAAALYSFSQLSERQLLAVARRMTADDRLAVLKAYVGERANRRHKPGRAFERTSYCFDILSDYGGFRDLQRHRLLTIDWQELTPYHGYTVPPAIEELGAASQWHEVMCRTAELYQDLRSKISPTVAQYAVPLAYRIRFYMHLDAREAMHIIELRTGPQGHPAYRRICQRMRELIDERAGHSAIAASMTFADRSEVELERLQAERRAEQRRPVEQFRLFSSDLGDQDGD